MKVFALYDGRSITANGKVMKLAMKHFIKVIFPARNLRTNLFY